MTVLGLDYQRAPSATVFGTLVLETLADLIKAVGFHSRDVIGFTGLVLQSQSNWKRGDEVDIADVDEQLPAIESELAESKVGVRIRVSWVEDRRFHQSWSWVYVELQTLADREPDTSTSNAWNSGGDGVSGRTEVDGDIFGQVLTG